MSVKPSEYIPHDTSTLIQPTPTEYLLYTWYRVISWRQNDAKDVVPILRELMGLASATFRSPFPRTV